MMPFLVNFYIVRQDRKVRVKVHLHGCIGKKSGWMRSFQDLTEHLFTRTIVNGYFCQNEGLVFILNK